MVREHNPGVGYSDPHVSVRGSRHDRILITFLKMFHFSLVITDQQSWR